MKTPLGNWLAQNPDLVPQLQIYVDNVLVKDAEVTDGYTELNIPMTDHESDVYDIELRTNCHFNPKNIGLNEDTRGLCIKSRRMWRSVI